MSGTIDEVFRHCNSKLAFAHFVSSKAAARRVMALGEPREAIHVIGSPELDFHAQPASVTMEEVRAHYAIPFEDYGVALFHPVTSEQATMARQAADLYSALEESGRNFVLIAPNNDPGSEEIFKVIHALPKTRFRLIPSMRFAHFSELMKHAACLVGNSSAGVREAPFLGIPSLDIGTRQANRSTASSIQTAEAQDRPAILEFLKTRWGKRCPRDTGFGEGGAAGRFVKILQDPEFWARGLQKEFRDLD